MMKNSHPTFPESVYVGEISRLRAVVRKSGVDVANNAVNEYEAINESVLVGHHWREPMRSRRMERMKWATANDHFEAFRRNSVR